MEQLINNYKNSVQNLEDAIASAERIHKPDVLAARENVVKYASSDTWELKKVKNFNKCAIIFNETLILVNIKNNSADITNKQDIQITIVEELKRKIVNNYTLDGIYKCVHDKDYDYEIIVKLSNNAYTIKYDSYHNSFQYNISKTNLLYILNNLVELYYERN